MAERGAGRGLDGAVAVITGAGSGIGRAGALRFAAAGARVVAADVNASAARETAESIRVAGGAAEPVTADVSREEDCARMIDEASAFGTVSVIWANAGIPYPQRPIAETPVADFDRVLGINARGAWLTARAGVPELKSAGGGSIVLTASMAGVKGRANNSAYAASKGAVVMLAKALAIELAPHRIRVNTVSPAAADTPMLPSFVSEGADAAAATTSMAAAIPLGRLCSAEDVADAALFLASDAASMITGVNLQVDGGFGA